MNAFLTVFPCPMKTGSRLPRVRETDHGLWPDFFKNLVNTLNQIGCTQADRLIIDLGIEVAWALSKRKPSLQK